MEPILVEANSKRKRCRTTTKRTRSPSSSPIQIQQKRGPGRPPKKPKDNVPASKLPAKKPKDNEPVSKLPVKPTRVRPRKVVQVQPK